MIYYDVGLPRRRERRFRAMLSRRGQLRSPRHGAHQRTRRALSAMIKHCHFNFREDTNSKIRETCVYQLGKPGNKRDQSFRPETMLERTFLRPTVRAMAA